MFENIYIYTWHDKGRDRSENKLVNAIDLNLTVN